MSRSSHPSVLLRLDQRGGSQVMWVGHVPRLPCAQEPGNEAVARVWVGHEVPILQGERASGYTGSSHGGSRDTRLPQIFTSWPFCAYGTSV